MLSTVFHILYICKMHDAEDQKKTAIFIQSVYQNQKEFAMLQRNRRSFMKYNFFCCCFVLFVHVWIYLKNCITKNNHKRRMDLVSNTFFFILKKGFHFHLPYAFECKLSLFLISLGEINILATCNYYKITYMKTKKKCFTLCL